MSKDTLFDRRTVARNLKNGRTSRKELDQHLASLPDVSGKAIPIFSPQEPRASRVFESRVEPIEDEADDELDIDEEDLDDDEPAEPEPGAV